jgi:hypothetical protein
MTNFFRNCGASFRTESVKAGAQAPTSVTLFDQGLIDVLEAAVTGLQPMQPYFLAFSDNADGSGQLQLLEDFTTNAVGAQIVNTVGPILEIVQGGADAPRRYLVIASGSSTNPGTPVQVQVP